MSIEVTYPDVIPVSLLRQADKDPEISGFVYPSDQTKQRAGIYLDGKLVGFFSPREESNGWRIGAIYILPEIRNLKKGIGGEAISLFFKTRKAAPVPISITNIASQKAFQKSGFIDTKEKIIEPDGWVGTWWVRTEKRNLASDYKDILN